MESIKVLVSLSREMNSDPQKVSLIFEDNYSFPEIILSDETTDDLKNFFNAIFNYIIKHEKIIEFQLKDEGSDMFREVADDVINQLNSEIRHSEDNFNEFLDLIKQNK